MVKVQRVSDVADAWQYPAPELANLSAMPPWLVDCSAVGGVDLYVETIGGIHRAQPGDWLVRLPSGYIEHVRKDAMAATYERAHEPLYLE